MQVKKYERDSRKKSVGMTFTSLAITISSTASFYHFPLKLINFFLNIRLF